jgi:hypothetical protein
MNREELDTLWFQAMRQSIEEGEDFIRYHFAALVADHEREACAKVCEEVGNRDADTHAWDAADAIRARGEVPR